MSNLPQNVGKAARFFHLESWFRLLLLCVLVGVVSGCGAIVFDAALRFLEHRLLSGWLFNDTESGAGRWALLALPALGGALAGGLAVWLAPEASGHGTDAVIRAFHRKKGEIRARVPIVKGICSILTIGSGGSAGKEGPIAQIGAGFGSTLARVLKLSVRDRRILMLAGVAGGIGAIFKAPLGGALFAAEVLYRDPDFEHDAIIPGVISSVTAYSVFTAFAGYHRILEFHNAAGVPLPPITFPSPDGYAGAELLQYAVLSILCAVVAFLLVKSLSFFERSVFGRIPAPRPVKAALGGLLLGALALLLTSTVGQIPVSGQVLGTSRPEHIMGGGYDYLQWVVNSALNTDMNGHWTTLQLAGFLSVVVLAKIVATSLTIGSGGSGGVLFPSLFLGGMTGAAYAKFWRAFSEAGWIPSWLALSPNARAGMILVGMGGVFAACTKTPIASLVMVSEITGSYGLVVPLMMTCASAYILSHSFTINEEQVPGIADSPAHRGEFLVNVLAEIRVSEAMTDAKPEMFAADTPFTAILERIKGSTASVFPVVDEKACLVGIFSLSDIRQIMNEQSVGTLIVAGDLGTSEVATVTVDTNLDEALRLFIQLKNVDELPVVETPRAEEGASKKMVSKAIKRPRGPAGTERVIGMLSRRDVILAYHRRLNQIQSAEAQDHAGSRLFVDALLPSTPARLFDPREDEHGVPDVAELRGEPVNDAASAGPDLLEEPKDDSETGKR